MALACVCLLFCIIYICIHLAEVHTHTCTQGWEMTFCFCTLSCVSWEGLFCLCQRVHEMHSQFSLCVHVCQFLCQQGVLTPPQHDLESRATLYSKFLSLHVSLSFASLIKDCTWCFRPCALTRLCDGGGLRQEQKLGLRPSSYTRYFCKHFLVSCPNENVIH